MFSICSALIYAAQALLSHQFAWRSDYVGRPILGVLVLFAVQFVLYAAALVIAVRSTANFCMLATIWGGSVVFRSILLPSHPIQEADLYRYIWDGAVFAEGIDPYQVPPQSARELADLADNEELQDEVPRRIARLQAEIPALQAILRRVHYGRLTSPYPPVSQAVFASAVWLTPSDASVWQHVVTMKAVLVIFDLATIALVMWLLSMARMHRGWSIAYAWCPLVLKEVANSGHLDSIAIFFSIASVALVFWSLRRAEAICRRDAKDRQCSPLKPAAFDAVLSGGLLASAVLLALAIGAKLYPVVLVPLFGLSVLRRLGWVWLAVPVVVTISLSAALLWPMLDRPPTTTDSTQESDQGLLAFLSRWEMNDLIFMVLYENLRPQPATTDGESRTSPWFTWFSDSLSGSVTEPLAEWANQGRQAGDRFTVHQVAFGLTRLMTLLAWLVIAVAVSWRATRRSTDLCARRWLGAAFLSIAWFWLLSPTQNPWYWCWAVPLLPFARCRAWLLLAACSMLYYLRFWLLYHYGDRTMLFLGKETPYLGEHYFYYVIVWLEFLPWYLVLAVEAWTRRRGRKRGATQPTKE